MSKDKLLFWAKKYTILIIMAVFFLIFSISTKGFLSKSNLMNILLQQSPIGVMCVAATFVIINGYRDLSVGMAMGLSACLTVGLQEKLGVFGMLVALLACAIIGIINGFLVAKLEINSFIATLAMMLGTRSITYMYTNEMVQTGKLLWFAEFGAGELLGVPNLIWVFLSCVIIGELVLRNTLHGRLTYAVGGNPEAAKNAGINVLRTTMINFVVVSLGGALGGILTAARMNAGLPELGWPNTHFLVIVMVVLGGTKLSGGYGNVLYTLGGVITYGMIQNFLTLNNVHTFLTQMLTGVILILVLCMDKVLQPTLQKRGK